MDLSIDTICDNCIHCPGFELELNQRIELKGSKGVETMAPACRHVKLCRRAIETWLNSGSFKKE